MKAFKKLVSIVMISCTLLLVGCSGDTSESTGGTPTKAKPVVQLNAEAERAAAQKVLETFYKAYYETFDAPASIPTGIVGNSFFLDHLKEGVSREETAALVEAAYQGRVEFYGRQAQKWAEFTAAGGYIEYGVDVYALIDEDHYYYDKCVGFFRNDEDTCFIDPDGIEAFMECGIGIDWYVPRTMESEWGKTRYEGHDGVMVRYKGQWYVAPIPAP